MSKNILVTFDFDDTVSPIDRGAGFDINPDYTVYHFGFQCAVRNKVKDFLQQVNKMSTVDVKWVSSWVDSTETFYEKSNGGIPHFDYLPISDSLTKAESIFEYANKNGITEVHVFEDDVRVRNQLTKLVTLYNSPLKVVFYLCKKQVGITDNMIGKFLSNIHSGNLPL